MELLENCAVEWRALGEVAELKRGKMITAKDKIDGDIPVISGGQKPAYYNSEFNRDGETITVAGSGAYAGYLMYWDKPIFVSDAFSVKPNLLLLNTRYVYHFLLSNQAWIHNLQKGSGVPHVYPKDLATIQIPIPPLTIQREIVRILDNFTELNTELNTELAARKKQYAYYRDALLSYTTPPCGHPPTGGEYPRPDQHLAPNSPPLEGWQAQPDGVVSVEWKTLGEVGNVRMCKRILKEQTTSEGEVPFYKIGTFGKEPDAYIPRQLFEEYKANYNYPKFGEILISASGTIGRTVIFDGKDSYFQDSNIIWIENNEELVLNKYLFYFYQIANWGISDGGTIQRLYNENVRKLKIPIPPLPEQTRIVAILDQFDALTHSISQGLPREIELRQKQYEYYREQLLGFKNSPPAQGWQAQPDGVVL